MVLLTHAPIDGSVAFLEHSTVEDCDTEVGSPTQALAAPPPSGEGAAAPAARLEASLLSNEATTANEGGVAAAVCGLHNSAGRVTSAFTP